MHRPSWPLLLGGVLLLGAVGGCGQDEPKATKGEAATWEVDQERPPQPTDTTVLALVSRVECANGRTGRVLTPLITEDEQRVVVTYTVERTPNKDATCPGNRPVGQTFTLKQPLGVRTLYDGACPRPEDQTDCESRQVWPML